MRSALLHSLLFQTSDGLRLRLWASGLIFAEGVGPTDLIEARGPWNVALLHSYHRLQSIHNQPGGFVSKAEKSFRKRRFKRPRRSRQKSKGKDVDADLMAWTRAWKATIQQRRGQGTRPYHGNYQGWRLYQGQRHGPGRRAGRQRQRRRRSPYCWV